MISLGSVSVRQALGGLEFQLPERSSVPEIEILLNRSVLLGGKRLRPLLTFLIADCLEIPLEKVAPFARAAEFTHAATLAHDDVIDEARLRRHRATINARASNSRAVLAGDFLLAKALKEISSAEKPELVAGLASVLEELVSGEWLQLEARGITHVGLRHLEEVARKKTASLISWCCTVAPVLRGCEPGTLRRFSMMGEYIGIAFQMIDDVIDYQQGGEKPFAQDLREGLVNLVTHHLMDQNPGMDSEIERVVAEFRAEEAMLESAGSPASAPVTRWPWSSEQLERARETVRQAGNSKIFAARELWAELVRELRLDEKAPSVRAIFEIIEKIPKRTA